MTISMVGADGYYSECKALLLCELALALLFLVKYVLVKKKKEISVAVHYGKILSVKKRQNFVRVSGVVRPHMWAYVHLMNHGSRCCHSRSCQTTHSKSN